MKHIRTNRKKESVGVFLVVEDAENNIGIYKDFGQTHVTSRTKWNEALAIAKLMDGAQRYGYKQGYDQCMTDIQEAEEEED